ncbi:MAG: hypothetical protein GY795_16100 [Desulfobacterales bacterium]|nr:hypothetical protein [Desulfobacterales bacterium]
MFDEIFQHPDLFGLTRAGCEENDVGVQISEQLNEEDFIVLKIDSFYNSLRLTKPPPSVDCLIIVKCNTVAYYDFYLAELKNINSPKHFDINNVVKKFETTIHDFLTLKFPDIFLNDEYCLNNLYLYFVSDVYRIKKANPDITKEEYDKKIKGLKIETFLSIKPFEFRGKKALISPLLPNPVVSEC